MEPLSKPSCIIYLQTIHATLREFNDRSLHSKNSNLSKKQLPKDPNLGTMKTDVIYGFFPNLQRKHLLTRDHPLRSYIGSTPFPN